MRRVLHPAVTLAGPLCLLLCVFAQTHNYASAADPDVASAASAAGSNVKPVGASSSESDEGGYRFRYKFEKGDVVGYEARDVRSMTTIKGQSKQTASNESHYWTHFEVLSVDADGSATLEMTIDRVKMSAQFDDNPPIAFDSDDNEEPQPGFKIIRETVGKPLTRVKFETNGKTVRVKNMTHASRPGAARSAVGEEAGRDVLIEFPDQRLKIGESWSDQYEVPVNVSRTLSQNVKIMRTYTLESVEDDVARFKVKSAVLGRHPDGQVRLQLVQRAPSGTVEFDMNKGRIVSRKLNIDKLELGVIGDDSSIRAVSERTETLIPADKMKAVKPASAEAAATR